MPKTRIQKEATVKDLTEKIGKSKAMVFTAFSGFTVGEAQELRKTCRDNGCEYMVVKKTLLREALKQHPQIQGVNPQEIKGNLSLVLGYEDEIQPAKILTKFVVAHPGLTIQAGVMERAFITVGQVQALGKLPSKEELIAKMVGSIAAPLSGTVGVLSGVLRQFVYALNAVGEKKSQS